MHAIIVAGSEETETELIVLKQEAPEIGLHRLDTNAETVEVIARGGVADVIIKKGFLNPHKPIGSIGSLGRFMGSLGPLQISPHRLGVFLGL